MKNLLFVLTALLLVTCNSSKDAEDVNEKDIIGKWILVAVDEAEDAPFVERRGVYVMDECDQQSVWEFLDEKAESLDDGTKTKVLVTTAPEECEFYDFDAKWAVSGSKIFLNTSRVGGIGGLSYAGKFEVNVSGDKLVLDGKYVKYSFKKAD